MSDQKHGRAGAVVSEQTVASEVGTSILASGGNAVDALVATCIAVNTLCPYHSDIGGGGFAIIRTKSGKYESWDFRHTAPSAATSKWYLDKSTEIGGPAVAVPGEIRGLEAVHKAHGLLPWADLFEPSIKLARDGMIVRGDTDDFVRKECIPAGSDNIAGSWIEKDPQMKATFTKDGKALPLGATWYRPNYAKTLEKIAKEGADAFYEGEIAEGIVRAVQARGGLMSLDDLKNYKCRQNTPLHAAYHGYKLFTVPAPASGAIWLSAMGTLSHFEPTTSGSIIDLHRLTEALRLAYGQRTSLGDPSFVPGLAEAQQRWISPESTAERAKMVSDDHTFPPDYYKPQGIEIKEDNGTSNITCADEDGLVISITTTVGLNFGSQIMVPESGIILNDSMDDFSVEGRSNGTGYEPSPANYVVGGKRPLSSSCPYIIENEKGEVVFAGGSAGGSTIISANTQVVRNALDYGMSAAEALRTSRLHNQILPNVSQIERASKTGDKVVDGFTEEQADGLRGKGHKLEWVAKNSSTPCAMRFFLGEDGKPDWEPSGDPRKFDAGGAVFR